MVLLKKLIFILNFYLIVVHLDAKKCPKGQKVTITKDNVEGCATCPLGYFQPEENDSQKCKVCTKCDRRFGIIVEKCTAVTDTKCKCGKGSIPWENETASCKCPIGFGIKDRECSKCENGYFTESIDSVCKKWKECKSGVIVNGTDKSDVTCNKEQKSNTDITTPTTSNKITSLVTHLRSLRPHEGAQTQEINQRTTTTTAAPRHAVTSRDIVHSTQPSITGNHIGMTLLIFGIIALLVLTAVTCKLHITPCVQRKQPVPTNDQLCRRPVEESGDDSLSSLKLNPGEP
ncbi:hypothetical protein PAMP_017506 [Pampus punctatissimus]